MGVSGWFSGWVCCWHVCTCVAVRARGWMLCDVGVCI